MDNLAKLQRHKAELQAQIVQQRSDLKKTLLEIREEIEPVKLLKNAISNVFGGSPSKPGEETPGMLGRLPAPISFVLDLLVRDPRLSFLLKFLGPVALKYLPKLVPKKSAPAAEEEAPAKPAKARFYGKLKQGVSALREKLQKPAPEKPAEKPEN